LSDFSGYALLALVGAIASALNVIAGGGSFLTLPVLIFLGLPPSVANATNRLGVLLQNVGAVWGFRRGGVVEWGSLRWAAVPATLGAGLGAVLALGVSDEAFRRILASLMVLVTLWTMLASPAPRRPEARRPGGALAWLVFLLIGVYGGFVQAGVGFFFVAATTWMGIDAVRGSAIKVLCVLALTALSLAIFASQGKVDWGSGLALGAGGVAGSLLGVHLTLLGGERFVRGVVTAAVVVFAVKLWLG
jgi:uncharacterized membrane protein YfcA